LEHRPYKERLRLLCSSWKGDDERETTVCSCLMGVGRGDGYTVAWGQEEATDTSCNRRHPHWTSGKNPSGTGSKF